MDTEEVMELFEELEEIIEINQTNCFNFCSMGGLFVILEMILTHEVVDVRQAACRLFSQLVSNNMKV